MVTGQYSAVFQQIHLADMSARIQQQLPHSVLLLSVYVWRYSLELFRIPMMKVGRKLLWTNVFLFSQRSYRTVLQLFDIIVSDKETRHNQSNANICTRSQSNLAKVALSASTVPVYFTMGKSRKFPPLPLHSHQKGTPRTCNTMCLGSPRFSTLDKNLIR